LLYYHPCTYQSLYLLVLSSFPSHMAHPQMNTVCSDCFSIFKIAASILYSQSAEEHRLPFGIPYEARLAINVYSSTCHMCTLLHTSIPQLLEPSDPEDSRELIISRSPHDRAAIMVNFIVISGDEPTKYPISIRIQNGEKVDLFTNTMHQNKSDRL
ncbi:MAG: hypothetical protein Q9157_005932, partial [Trypethelium eluteriae]